MSEEKEHPSFESCRAYPHEGGIEEPMSEEKEHPSFGVISWHRVSSKGPKDFFMSTVRPMDYITVKLHPSCQLQKGSTTRAFAVGVPICEVVMTEAQFAAFITTPNVASGTPCTINYLQGEDISPVPRDRQGDQHKQHKKDLQNTAAKASQHLNESLAKLDTILSGKSIRKRDLKELREDLQGAKGRIGGTLPHVLTLFDEYMEKVREEAEASFEGAVRQRIEDLGIGALPSAMPKAIKKRTVAQDARDALDLWLADWDYDPPASHEQIREVAFAVYERLLPDESIPVEHLLAAAQERASEFGWIED